MKQDSWISMIWFDETWKIFILIQFVGLLSNQCCCLVGFLMARHRRVGTGASVINIANKTKEWTNLCAKLSNYLKYSIPISVFGYWSIY